MVDEVFDPYLIPHTRVLKNKLNVQTQEDLDFFENDLVSVRSYKLYENLPHAEGTVKQLQWIHHYLFQDVYDWAGQIRTIDMTKGGGEPFHPLEYMGVGIRYCEQTLKNDNLLQGLSIDEFISKLSVNYNNFNVLHPFREGNGRTQRVFWDIVARDAGYHCDWGLITQRVNDKASIQAKDINDTKLLEEMFRIITKPLQVDLLAQQQFAHLVEEEYEYAPNVASVLQDKDYVAYKMRYGID
ncbi:Fic/DOC family protein [Gardnerella vaginalis]|uniref:Fic/DOC family protein n=1 Tax=Gardnerella vaginalis TaxID=2702 RepID=UPI0039EE457C